MFSVRRYVIYFCLAALIVITYNRLYDSQPQLAKPSLPPFKDSQVPDQFAGGHALDAEAKTDVTDSLEERPPGASAPPGFKWSEVKIDYPVPTYHALPTGKPLKLPRIQHAFTTETLEQSKVRKARQADVLAAFERGWGAYKKYAWTHDEILPLTGGSNDKFGGWGATLVDNLDTLWIMGLKREFEEAVQAVMDIDITTVKINRINVFETTIRHLGGLLSAYDLSGDKRCLNKAIEFGNMLFKAFDTPNHLPIARWLFEGAVNGVPQSNQPETVLLAELGSLSMEFTRLSLLTGDPKWFDAVHRITLLFDMSLPSTALPGMFPISIGVKIVDMSTDTTFTLNGMADSFFEYLPKMHLLLGGQLPVYQKLYSETIATATKWTLYRPMTPDNADILFSGVLRVKPTGPELTAQAQHLGCFTGGMYTLGGRLFDEPSYFKIGEKLTNGCVWAYKNFPLGIMTESATFVACDDRDSCKWNEKKWREVIQSRLLDDVDIDDYITSNRLVEGVTAYTDTKYHLRPEAIESVFLLYRMTGDVDLLDTAWDMYTAIMNSTTSDVANAALLDATHTTGQLNAQGQHIGAKQFDSMESFWLAETLKYFYLMFSEPDIISLDEWVFNTEAHPFRRPV